MDTKNFKKAVWEVRKKYDKSRLNKKQLKEAFDLYQQSGKNIEKFKELVNNIIKL